MSIYLVIISALIVDVLVMTVIHYIERKDLYSRIMCRDIHDYTKSVKTDIGHKEVSAHRRNIDKWKSGGDES